jgi:hypothetical protein
VEASVQLAISNIELYCKNEGITKLFLTGSEIERVDKNTITQIVEGLSTKGIQTVYGENICYDAAAAKNRYAKKKDIQLQNLPISKMNCADSTERPLKLPEPVFHCVDIFHHQPDNIDVPAGIPAHEELSGCF